MIPKKIEIDIHKGFPEIDLAEMITQMQERNRQHDIYGSAATLIEIELVLKQLMTEDEFAAALVAIRITKPLE